MKSISVFAPKMSILSRIKNLFLLIILITFKAFTAWKVSAFGVIPVHIFPYSDQNNSKYGQLLRSNLFLK